MNPARLIPRPLWSIPLWGAAFAVALLEGP
jgi:hypothetical protein